MPTTTISTPVPAGVTKEQLLATLHDHDSLVKTISGSTYISHTHESGSAGIGEADVFSVTDKKPIGQTTYKLTITNREDGVDTLVNAKPPIGTLTIAGKWRIVEEGGKLVLKEDVDIDANMIMKKMVKGNVDKTHPEQHSALMQQAQKA